jgi:hypothetical protein
LTSDQYAISRCASVIDWLFVGPTHGPSVAGFPSPLQRTVGRFSLVTTEHEVNEHGEARHTEHKIDVLKNEHTAKPNARQRLVRVAKYIVRAIA